MARDPSPPVACGPRRRRSVVARPQLARVGACVLVLALATSAHAQPKDKPAPTKPAAGDKVEPKQGKPKVFDFTGLDISGRLRTPQLLYFLDRASEELERASLERRSFVPEMVRSVDEAPL